PALVLAAPCDTPAGNDGRHQSWRRTGERHPPVRDRFRRWPSGWTDARRTCHSGYHHLSGDRETSSCSTEPCHWWLARELCARAWRGKALRYARHAQARRGATLRSMELPMDVLGSLAKPL